MAADGYKVQISGNIGNGLFVLLGDSVAELVQQSADLAASADEIYENLVVVQQTVLAKEVFKSKDWSKPAATAVPANQTAQQATQPKSTPAGPSVRCAHGDMQWKDFTSRAGKDIKGHFCPSTDRDDQCPPKYKR
jgi:hypothetical protein